MYVPSPSEMDSYAQIVIRKSSFSSIVTRKFSDIGALAAYVGGLWALLFKLTKLVTHYLNRLHYEKIIADAIYNFEDSRHDKQIKKISNSPSPNQGEKSKGVFSFKNAWMKAS